MDKKKSKFLSWLRIPEFMQKNQGSTNKAVDTAKCKKQGNPMSCGISQTEQCVDSEAIPPVQCCCHYISKQMQALNVCHPSSYHNISRCKHQHYSLANEHLASNEVKREHLQALENKENVPGSWYRDRNCCKDIHHDCCQKAVRSRIHLYEYSDCTMKQGCTCCSQAVLLAPKCLRRQLKPCEVNRSEANNYQGKYRSIGINTTPQQISAAAETNLCSMADCVPSFCQNADLFTKCNKISQHKEHLIEPRCKIRDQCFNNVQLKLLERNSKRGLSKVRENHAPTVIRCDHFSTKYGQSKLATASRITTDTTESHKHRQKQRNERILKARLHYMNKTLPKGWKHKTAALRDDDSKSTFADDEKSELDSSGGTNFVKQTCL